MPELMSAEELIYTRDDLARGKEPGLHGGWQMLSHIDAQAQDASGE